jgi:hypothetical protein
MRRRVGIALYLQEDPVEIVDTLYLLGPLDSVESGDVALCTFEEDLVS